MNKSGWGYLGPTPEGLQEGSVLTYPHARLLELGSKLRRLFDDGRLDRDFLQEADRRLDYDEEGEAVFILSVTSTFGETVSVRIPYAECEWKLLQ